MSSTSSSRPATALLALRDVRERSISQLSDAFAHDQLEMDEFERRLAIAHRSESTAELQALTADLTPTTDSTALAPRPALAHADIKIRDTQRLLLVMGGTSRKGRWTPARNLRIIAVMGGAELDFREAVMAPGIYDLHITAVLGGVTIYVPPKLAIEVEGSAVLGGFEHSERAPLTPDPERPVLRVHGLAVLGGVHVETLLPGDQPSGMEHRGHRKRRELATAGPRPALPAVSDGNADR